MVHTRVVFAAVMRVLLILFVVMRMMAVLSIAIPHDHS